MPVHSSNSPFVFYRKEKNVERKRVQNDVKEHYFVKQHKITANADKTHVNEWKAVHVKGNMACSKSFQ